MLWDAIIFLTQSFKRRTIERVQRVLDVPSHGSDCLRLWRDLEIFENRFSPRPRGQAPLSLSRVGEKLPRIRDYDQSPYRDHKPLLHSLLLRYRASPDQHTRLLNRAESLEA